VTAWLRERVRSFNPRINEHKPVEYRKKAQRDAMEEAAAEFLRQHQSDNY
jgi:hypothetical protein